MARCMVEKGFRRSVGISILIAAAAALAVSVTPASASYRLRHHHYHHRHSASHHHYAARAAGPLYRGALLVDADSGKTLYAYNADMSWPPASMAKMMMLLVAEDQIKAGRVKLTDPVRISENSATTMGSRLGLREGEVIPLGELMKAALIRSANDAAVAVAEKIAGSTQQCVVMMNAKARSLGMTDTVYKTIDGLPPTPGHDVDTTTANDLVKVARALIYTTNLLQWSSLQTAPFDDGVTTLHNTNHLIGHFEGCDGLKTGFTYHAGFNLTATAKRGNMRLIAVVLGTPSNGERFSQAARLLDWGFDNYERLTVLKRGQLLPVHVQVGANETIQPICDSDVDVLIPKRDASAIKVNYLIPPSYPGPIKSDAAVGQVVVSDGDSVLTRAQAICPLPASTVSVAASEPVRAPAVVPVVAPASVPGGN